MMRANTSKANTGCRWPRAWVLTIEPGCYVRPADDVPEAFWNIGVRIEDDAVVTAGGCEIITADAPKKIADIEALMRDARNS
jgi:Xaa-Pro aminopeptidase